MATIKFVQAQKFSLSGSGATIGDTTITLQSFALPNGTLIQTTDLGIKAYGTLEPGNGSQEEQISFTGVTQNSNGTATLTGVSSVGFVSPYTETSGLSKTHAGATTFILSNDAGFYGQILSYIDTAIVSGGVPATTTVLGLNKISIAPVSAASPIAVGDNDPRVPTQTEKNYLASVATTNIPYVVATGTATALTGTLASSVSTLASGTHINVLIPLTTASGVTLNINSLGAKTLKKNVSSTLASGDLIAGQIANMTYDGTNFQVINAGINLTKVGSGATSYDLSTASGNQTIAHGLGVTPRIVRIEAYFADDGNTTSSATISSAKTVYSNGTQSSIYQYMTGGSSATGNASLHGNTFTLYTSRFSNNFSQSGVVTVDATNITIAWTKSSTPSGTAYIVWEALA